MRCSSRTAQCSVRQATAGERELRVQRSTAGRDRLGRSERPPTVCGRRCVMNMSVAAISDRRARSRFHRRGRECGRRAKFQDAGHASTRSSGIRSCGS